MSHPSRQQTLRKHHLYGLSERRHGPPLPLPRPLTEQEVIEQRRACEALFLKNQTNSPLLDLPAEIRKIIFDYVYMYKKTVSIYASRGTTGRIYVAPTPLSLQYPRILLSLPRTCRQINAETKHLPFATGKLVGDYLSVETTITTKLNRAQADAITNIELRLDNWTQLEYWKHGHPCHFSSGELIAKVVSHLTPDLRALCELHGLKKLALIPGDKYSKRQDWDTVSGYCLAAVREVFRGILSSAKTEVVVVSFTDATFRQYRYLQDKRYGL